MRLTLVQSCVVRPRFGAFVSVWQEMDADNRPPGNAFPLLLDATRLVAWCWSGRQPTGIDRVCIEYARHFARRAQAVVQHRGVIFTLGPSASQRLFDLVVEDVGQNGRSKVVRHLAGALSSHRPAAAGSLYLNVGHTDYDLSGHARWIARRHLRAIYLVHDLIPILHPEHCRPRAVARHTGRVRGALRCGSGIVVGSAAVANDLHDYADRNYLARPPVVVSPLAGADLRGRNASDSAAGNYFLCVGTIESRKNHILLVRVWERLFARMGAAAPRLVLAGRWGSGSDAFREALLASKMVGGLVQVVDECDDDMLAGLMTGSRAVLMPSRAEGFGLPMAEALALGVPVIASDLPCFREVGQGIPSLLNPDDLAGWEARIVELYLAASQRQRRTDALRGYRAPTWKEHFARIEPWLETIGVTPPRTRIRHERSCTPAIGQKLWNGEFGGNGCSKLCSTL